jgi:hypothetical protein
MPLDKLLRSSVRCGMKANTMLEKEKHINKNNNNDETSFIVIASILQMKKNEMLSLIYIVEREAYKMYIFKGEH